MINTKRMRAAIDAGTLSDSEARSLCFELDARLIKMAMMQEEIDRLRGERQTPQGKTVDVRFEACVDGKGNAEIAAYRLNDDGTSWQGPMMWPGAKRYTLTATLPVPAEVEVVARVEEE